MTTQTDLHGRLDDLVLILGSRGGEWRSQVAHIVAALDNVRPAAGIQQVGLHLVVTAQQDTTRGD